MPERPPQVIREFLFEEKLAALQLGDFRVADEFVEAAEYCLACDPQLGLQIAPGSLVWALPMASVRARDITLYYMFDDQVVRFLAIEAS